MPGIYLPVLMLMLVAIIVGCGVPEAEQSTTGPLASPSAAPASSAPATGEASASPTSELVEVTPEPSTGVAGASDLEGEIVVAFATNDKQTWQALADAYMKLHPKVQVKVELRPEEGYDEWVRAQIAGGTSNVALVRGFSTLQDLFPTQFPDFAPYLDHVSPYTGKPWREGLRDELLQQMVDASTGTLYTFHSESIQIVWLYNKEAFSKAGILEEAEELAKTEFNQPTWSQFLSWCDKLKDAGYFPVAIEGDEASLKAVRWQWMYRIYADQFFRDTIQLYRAQPGDWNYREGIDDRWTYDPSDLYIDFPFKVTANEARRIKLFQDGKIRLDGPEVREIFTQFTEFANRCAQPGFLGTKDAYPLFLTQKAAMRLDGSWLLPSVEKDIKSLAEGRYGQSEDQPTPTVAPDAQATVFEYGVYNAPTMEGSPIKGRARTLEGPVGHWSILKQDQQQNDLIMDFVMWATSPDGMNLYVENKLDPNNPNGSLGGPPITKDVELPPEYAERFAALKSIGGIHHFNAMGPYIATSFTGVPEGEREFASLAQQYFGGQLTLDEFLKQYQAAMERLQPEVLKHLQLTVEDVEHPEKQPASVQQ